MVPLSMTLSDLWPRFQDHDIFEVEYRKNGTSLKTKSLLHKRKLYLTYGMVLCLVTLTDHLMRRAGQLNFLFQFQLHVIDGQANAWPFSVFTQKQVFWPSYCQISTDLDKILHTPIVVRNTLCGPT